MALAAVLFRALPSELAPAEDRGMMYIGMTGPEGATLEYMDRHARMLEDILMAEVADGEVVRAIVRVPGGFGGGAQMNQGRGFLLLAAVGRARAQRRADRAAHPREAQRRHPRAYGPSSARPAAGV